MNTSKNFEFRRWTSTSKFSFTLVNSDFSVSSVLNFFVFRGIIRYGIVLLSLIGFLVSKTYSQTLPPVNCTTATVICDSVIVQDTLKVAIDSTAEEISSNSCLTFGEIRGTWYQFGVNDIGNLRFTITPFDTLTDFDWALFRVDWANCTDIFAVPSYEVSCSESGIGGGFYTTGLSDVPVQGFNPSINLTTPAVFYLYITTSLQDTGALLGYTIDFSASDFDLVPCNEIGIEEEDFLSVTMFPNPASDRIFISSLNFIPEQYVLTDITGKQVAASSSNWRSINGIDLTGFSTGIYYYQLIDATGRKLSGKVIVK